MDVPQIPGVTHLEWVGGGGFGAVYRGFQAEYDRPVAVKVLQLAVADRKALSRFDRERKLMGRLSSRNRNVVTVFDSGVLPDGRPYLVTEYCAGGSLAGRPPMPVATVLDLGVKIATALRVAHRDDVVHRDVKPANILLRADGEPALADFGLSIRPSYDLSRGLDALAPEYAAPESLQNGVYDAATDIYALGATLYALLESAPPFPHLAGEAPMAYMTRVIRDAVPAPRQATLPPGLWQLLTEMLAKDPIVRPDAEQVAQRLTGLRAGGPVEVPRSGPATPAGTPPSGPGTATVGVGGDTTRLRADPAAAPAQRTGDTDLTRHRATFTTEPVVPPRPRRRIPVAAVVGGAAAAVLLAGGATAVVVLGGDDPAAAPSAAVSGPPVAASAPQVVLAEPVDRTNSVDLTWRSDAVLQYAVIIGEQGRAPRTELVRGRTSTSVPVTPGAPYCFQIQATAGGPVFTSNVRSIRGAVCTFG